ncbi:hypothetical protein AB1Y20_016347 [Prymnesium parvum]|uniref:Choice-of-anchor B family protein n=1 Tax=Prymnesium parvum TaxID=97485 RepID=A0AB34IF23_PRYPA
MAGAALLCLAAAVPMPDMHMEPTEPPAGRTDPSEYASRRVALLAQLASSACCEGQYASDVWGFTDPSTNAEYALITYRTGMAVVDVSVPTAPALLGRVASPSSVWKDVKTYGHFAYLVTEAAGSDIVVVDLSNRQVRVVGNVVASAGTAYTHNVAIDETSGYLYRLGGGDHAMRVYSLAQPEAPQFVGEIGDAYIHDAEVLTFTSGAYAGRQVAFACKAESPHGLQLWDVTDKQAATLLSFASWPGASYSHNVWVDLPTMRAFVADELDHRLGRTSTVYVFDVSDLTQPVYTGSFTNGNSAITHNFIIRGDYLYHANYESGLRIFDIRHQPIGEVAFFDTFPAADRATFDGAWGVYVLPRSGTILVSDQQRGLFVLAFDETPLPASPPPAPPRPPFSPFPPAPPPTSPIPPPPPCACSSPAGGCVAAGQVLASRCGCADHLNDGEVFCYVYASAADCPSASPSQWQSHLPRRIARLYGRRPRSHLLMPPGVERRMRSPR